MAFASAVMLIAKLGMFSASLTAAGFDVARRIIPNEAVAVVAGSGLVMRLLSPADYAIWISLAAALVVYLAFDLLSHLNVVGGGDVKLISALSLCVAADEVMPLLMWISLAGGALACAYLLRNWLVGFVHLATPAASSLPRIELPYGVAIFLGLIGQQVTGALQ